MAGKNYSQSLQYNNVSISINQSNSDVYCQRGHILFNLNDLNKNISL